MQVLVVGDTHADYQFVANVTNYAREIETNVAVQVGDFGFGFNGFSAMLSAVTAWLDEDEDRVWYWIDGNHDNHDALQVVVAENGRTPYQFTHGRLLYIPRGAVFNIGDKVCMGLGGAHSVDLDARIPHVSWWPGESIGYMDMHTAADNAEEFGPIDVMFTHDAPMSDVLESMLKGPGYKMDPDSTASRRNLSYIVDEVRPKILFHGHYHYRYQAMYTTPEGWDVLVHGIGANLVPDLHRGGQKRDPAVRLNDNVLEVEF